MAKAPATVSGASEAEDLVSVKLLYGYIASNAEYETPPDEPNTKIYRKSSAGDVIQIPRDEAQRLVDLDKAKAVF